MQNQTLLIILIILIAILIIIIFVRLLALFLKKNKQTEVKNTENSNIQIFEKTLENTLEKTNHAVKEIVLKELSEFKDKQAELREKELKDYNDSIGKISALKEEIKQSFNLFKDKQHETTSQGLKENLVQTGEMIKGVTEQLTRIDDAQKQIGDIKGTIDEFSRIMNDKKSRGNLGEFIMETLFDSVFGEVNNHFQRQVTLSNKMQVDGIIQAPAEIGKIPIDSKFPFEDYQAIERAKTDSEKDAAEKTFITNCKNKIKEISEKYILPGETADFALMFIPAEAIFIAIHSSRFQAIINFAKQKNVYIVSPSTLFIVIQNIYKLNNIVHKQKNLRPILSKLSKLAEEFKRFQERWETFIKRLESEKKAIEDLDITQDKIVNKFSEINKLTLDDKITDNEKLSDTDKNN